MQNTEDRGELLRRHGGGEGGPLSAVLKCAAGLFALIAVAAGPWLLLSPERDKAVAVAPAATFVRTHPNAVAESKRVFDERRQRYQARARAMPVQEGLVAGAKADDSPSK